MIRTVAVALTFSLVACAAGSNGQASDDPTAPPPLGEARLSGNHDRDQATLHRLMDEARQLARTDGCAGAGDCSAIAFGAKPCGGPRGYFAYCPVTTDLASLQEKVAQVDRFERAMNERYQLGSDCAYVTEPALQLIGGRCTAVP